MSDDLKRLADAAEALERQAGELRAEVERLAEAERERAAAEPTPVEPAPVDDSEARIVAFSMVLDGKPRDEVAQHLADEFGIADSEALLDDLYAKAG